MLPEKNEIKLIGFFKTCPTCNIRKCWIKFNKRSNRACGIATTCRKCSRLRVNTYRKTHKKEIAIQTKIYNRAYRKVNKSKVKIWSKNYRKKSKGKRRAYCIANKEKIKIQTKIYHGANKKRIKACAANYRKNNKEKIKNYRKKHAEEIRTYHRIYTKTKRKANSKFRLSRNMSTSIWASLKNGKNGHRWEDLVGYTIEMLRKHLEKQFTEDMDWENYGKWHLEHKIPIAAFNFTKPEHRDFKRCWTLSNLQPMWATENMKKHTKITKHFQPSLLI